MDKETQDAIICRKESKSSKRAESARGNGARSMLSNAVLCDTGLDERRN